MSPRRSPRKAVGQSHAPNSLQMPTKIPKWKPIDIDTKSSKIPARSKSQSGKTNDKSGSVESNKSSVDNSVPEPRSPLKKRNVTNVENQVEERISKSVNKLSGENAQSSPRKESLRSPRKVNKPAGLDFKEDTNVKDLDTVKRDVLGKENCPRSPSKSPSMKRMKLIDSTNEKSPLKVKKLETKEIVEASPLNVKHNAGMADKKLENNDDRYNEQSCETAGPEVFGSPIKTYGHRQARRNIDLDKSVDETVKEKERKSEHLTNTQQISPVKARRKESLNVRNSNTVSPVKSNEQSEKVNKSEKKTGDKKQKSKFWLYEIVPIEDHEAIDTLDEEPVSKELQKLKQDAGEWFSGDEVEIESRRRTRKSINPATVKQVDDESDGVEDAEEVKDINKTKNVHVTKDSENNDADEPQKDTDKPTAPERVTEDKRIKKKDKTITVPNDNADEITSKNRQKMTRNQGKQVDLDIEKSTLGDNNDRDTNISKTEIVEMKQTSLSDKEKKELKKKSRDSRFWTYVTEPVETESGEEIDESVSKELQTLRKSLPGRLNIDNNETRRSRGRDSAVSQQEDSESVANESVEDSNNSEQVSEMMIENKANESKISAKKDVKKGDVSQSRAKQREDSQTRKKEKSEKFWFYIQETCEESDDEENDMDVPKELKMLRDTPKWFSSDGEIGSSRRVKRKVVIDIEETSTNSIDAVEKDNCQTQTEQRNMDCRAKKPSNEADLAKRTFSMLIESGQKAGKKLFDGDIEACISLPLHDLATKDAFAAVKKREWKSKKDRPKTTNSRFNGKEKIPTVKPDTSKRCETGSLTTKAESKSTDVWIDQYSDIPSNFQNFDENSIMYGKSLADRIKERGVRRCSTPSYNITNLSENSVRSRSNSISSNINPSDIEERKKQKAKIRKRAEQVVKSPDILRKKLLKNKSVANIASARVVTKYKNQRLNAKNEFAVNGYQGDDEGENKTKNNNSMKSSTKLKARCKTNGKKFWFYESVTNEPNASPVIDKSLPKEVQMLHELQPIVSSGLSDSPVSRSRSKFRVPADDNVGSSRKSSLSRTDAQQNRKKDIDDSVEDIVKAVWSDKKKSSKENVFVEPTPNKILDKSKDNKKTKVMHSEQVDKTFDSLKNVKDRNKTSKVKNQKIHHKHKPKSEDEVEKLSIRATELRNFGCSRNSQALVELKHSHKSRIRHMQKSIHKAKRQQKRLASRVEKKGRRGKRTNKNDTETIAIDSETNSKEQVKETRPTSPTKNSKRNSKFWKYEIVTDDSTSGEESDDMCLPREVRDLKCPGLDLDSSSGLRRRTDRSIDSRNREKVNHKDQPEEMDDKVEGVECNRTGKTEKVKGDQRGERMLGKSRIDSKMNDAKDDKIDAKRVEKMEEKKRTKRQYRVYETRTDTDSDDDGETADMDLPRELKLLKCKLNTVKAGDKSERSRSRSRSGSVDSVQRKSQRKKVDTIYYTNDESSDDVDDIETDDDTSKRKDRKHIERGQDCEESSEKEEHVEASAKDRARSRKRTFWVYETVTNEECDEDLDSENLPKELQALKCSWNRLSEGDVRRSRSISSKRSLERDIADKTVQVKLKGVHTEEKTTLNTCTNNEEMFNSKSSGHKDKRKIAQAERSKLEKEPKREKSAKFWSYVPIVDDDDSEEEEMIEHLPKPLKFLNCSWNRVSDSDERSRMSRSDRRSLVHRDSESHSRISSSDRSVERNVRKDAQKLKDKNAKVAQIDKPKERTCVREDSKDIVKKDVNTNENIEIVDNTNKEGENTEENGKTNDANSEKVEIVNGSAKDAETSEKVHKRKRNRFWVFEPVPVSPDDADNEMNGLPKELQHLKCSWNKGAEVKGQRSVSLGRNRSVDSLGSETMRSCSCADDQIRKSKGDKHESKRVKTNEVDVEVDNDVDIIENEKNVKESVNEESENLHEKRSASPVFKSKSKKHSKPNRKSSPVFNRSPLNKIKVSATRRYIDDCEEIILIDSSEVADEDLNNATDVCLESNDNASEINTPEKNGINVVFSSGYTNTPRSENTRKHRKRKQCEVDMVEDSDKKRKRDDDDVSELEALNGDRRCLRSPGKLFVKQNLESSFGIEIVGGDTTKESRTVDDVVIETVKQSENLNGALVWEPINQAGQSGKSEKIKLNKSWNLLSERSLSKLVSSDNDHESFDGFEEKEVDNSLRSDLSFEECVEIDATRSDSEHDWIIEDEASDSAEPFEPLNFLNATLSSPGGNSNSSWIDACDEYIDRSLKQGNDEPCRNSSMYYSFTSPKKSPMVGRKQLFTPEKQRHQRTPVKTKTRGDNALGDFDEIEKRVDEDISFNFGSPQKNRLEFSPLRNVNGVITGDRSPIIAKMTSTPVILTKRTRP